MPGLHILIVSALSSFTAFAPQGFSIFDYMKYFFSHAMLISNSGY
jgi:hypothetical protein